MIYNILNGFDLWQIHIGHSVFGAETIVFHCVPSDFQLLFSSYFFLRYSHAYTNLGMCSLSTVNLKALFLMNPSTVSDLLGMLPWVHKSHDSP